MVVKCKNCKHWEPTKNGKGVCYRWAPVPVVLESGGNTFLTVWPETEGDRRCGEGEEA